MHICKQVHNAMRRISHIIITNTDARVFKLQIIEVTDLYNKMNHLQLTLSGVLSIRYIHVCKTFHLAILVVFFCYTELLIFWLC